MQVFKFNTSAGSVERAVADAIGQGLAARREQTDNVPQRFAQLVARFDEIHDTQRAHGTARVSARKGVED